MSLLSRYRWKRGWGWKEAQRQGEDKVTLWRTLLYKLELFWFFFLFGIVVTFLLLCLCLAYWMLDSRSGNKWFERSLEDNFQFRSFFFLVSCLNFWGFVFAFLPCTPIDNYQNPLHLTCQNLSKSILLFKILLASHVKFFFFPIQIPISFLQIVAFYVTFDLLIKQLKNSTSTLVFHFYVSRVTLQPSLSITIVFHH
jgi:hypothetical protein